MMEFLVDSSPASRARLRFKKLQNRAASVKRATRRRGSGASGLQFIRRTRGRASERAAGAAAREPA